MVALVGNAEEAGRLGNVAPRPPRAGDSRSWSSPTRRARPARCGTPAALKLVVRDCPRQPDFPLADADLAWIARHLTRTKLGVALGAGGAKGYAHVGVLQVLEEAGYTVDYVGGSSIGGFVASQVALGYDAAEVDARFRDAFSAENVGQLFKSPLVGSAGLETLTGMLKEATKGAFFSHTQIPLVVMAVDLTARAPVAQRQRTAVGGAARGAVGGRRVPDPGAERASADRRDRARPGPDRGRARGRRRHRRVGQPARHRVARALAGRPRRTRRRAGQAKTARTARHDPRGDGPQPARHQRAPRGARPTS